MATGNYCMLRMISAENNNKFYEMSWDGISSTFKAKYGRIDSTSTTIDKPYSEWNKIIKEKEKKGYKNVTHTVAETVVEKVNTSNPASLAKIENNRVDLFITLMQGYTKGLVQKTYSVKAKSVTKAQLDDAQNFINKLTTVDRSDEKAVNRILLDLYAVIPRFMSKVPLYLLPNIDIDKTFQQEQDNLDAMVSQVSIGKEEETDVVEKQKTLLDIMGVSMDTIESPTSEIQYLINQINQSGRKVNGIFQVNKPVENTIYDTWVSNQKNKDHRILIHGTRCSSVIPIIEQGLKIRPQGNFNFSGKVYGDGNYFSETVSKSLNYTGYDNDKILLVYEVHIGNPFIYDGWYRGNSFTLNYNELSKRGFDSTFVKAGGGLLNTEIIAYKEQQSRIKYIIHLK